MFSKKLTAADYRTMPWKNGLERVLCNLGGAERWVLCESSRVRRQDREGLAASGFPRNGLTRIVARVSLFSE